MLRIGAVAVLLLCATTAAHRSMSAHERTKARTNGAPSSGTKRRSPIDFSATVSCYQADSQGRACGRCDSCRIRRVGFESAGIERDHVPGNLSGRLEVKWGDHLEQTVTIGPGDMVYVPPRETHLLQNLSDAEPAEYVVARDSPTEDSVEVPWAG